jgi:glycosyltransferase involved in cell wall biosynthesis
MQTDKRLRTDPRNQRVRTVLFVTTSFPRFPGDFAGSFVFRFAKYLARDGAQMTVLAPGAPGYPVTEQMEGVRVHRFSYFYPTKYQRLAYGEGGILARIGQSWLAKLQIPLFFLAMVMNIRRYQKHVDIIHCHWLPTALAALVARVYSRAKPAIILTNWGSDTRHLPAWLIRWTVARMDGCISTAVETDEHLLDAGRTEFRRIMAPVDEDRFRPSIHHQNLRQELGIDTNIPVITFIGRLIAPKDPLTFIRACSLLKQRNVPFVALVAGDGDLMPSCQKEVQQYGLHEQVRLLGMRSDPERLLGIATASVNISSVENTWANVIAEAMFMGVPVVLSDAGYTKHLFTHEKDCFIIPSQNHHDLADALQCLMYEKNLRLKLIEGAKELLRSYKKDSRSVVRETRDYYDEIQRPPMRNRLPEFSA